MVFTIHNICKATEGIVVMITFFFVQFFLQVFLYQIQWQTLGELSISAPFIFNSPFCFVYLSFYVPKNEQTKKNLVRRTLG